MVELLKLFNPDTLIYVYTRMHGRFVKVTCSHFLFRKTLPFLQNEVQLSILIHSLQPSGHRFETVPRRLKAHKTMLPTSFDISLIFVLAVELKFDVNK